MSQSTEASQSQQFSSELIGRDRNVYKYIDENREAFIKWHATTHWARTEARKPDKKKRKVVTWGVDRKAAFWDCFVEGADRLTGHPKIVCRRCDMVLGHTVINGTTGMSVHPQTKGCLNTAKQRGLQQLSIQEGFMESKRKVESDLINSGPLKLIPASFDQQLLRTIIGCYWSISVIDSLEFKRMIKCTNPSIVVISSSTLTRRILEHRMLVEEDIKQKLPKAPAKVAIVLDCWSAPRREGFIAIKAYWVTEEWEIAEAMIGFEPVTGDHSGSNLGEITFRRLQRFGLHDRLSAITSDNASNNKTLKAQVDRTAAVENAIAYVQKKVKMDKVHQLIALVPCLAHVIQLAVTQLLFGMKINTKNSEIQRNWEQIEEDRVLALSRGSSGEQPKNNLPYTISKARALAVYINHSETRWNAFKAIQEKLQAEKTAANAYLPSAKIPKRYRVLRCFQDVRTRWDSTNRMLMRLVKIREAVDKFTPEHCQHLSLSDLEWQQIDYVITILHPFAVFTQFIGTTRDPTIHQVFEVYEILLSHILTCKTLLERKRVPWKRHILDGLEGAEKKLKKYYQDTEYSEAGKIYGMAILLNPHAKDSTWRGLHWQGTTYQQEYWVALEALWKAEYRDRQPKTQRLVVPKNLRPKKQVDFDHVMAVLTDDRPKEQDHGEEILSDADAEWVDYRQHDGTLTQATKPLDNWRLCEKRFPRIALMVRDIYAIQGAGVGIEREFSIAGNFNLDNKTYSAKLLAALMVCHHAQHEENREIKRGYYLLARVEAISPEELEAEEEEDDRMLNQVIEQIRTVDISDTEEFSDDEDNDKEMEDLLSDFDGYDDPDNNPDDAVSSQVSSQSVSGSRVGLGSQVSSRSSRVGTPLPSRGRGIGRAPQVVVRKTTTTRSTTSTSPQKRARVDSEV